MILWHRRKANYFVLLVSILLSSLIFNWSDATGHGTNLDHSRQRKCFFFLRWQEVKTTLSNSTREHFALVYVSTFRNATDLYFNLILEQQPSHIKFFQITHIEDEPLMYYNKMAPNDSYCLTLMHSYNLRDEHVVRHIVVFTKEKGRNCSEVKFVCNQNSLLAVRDNILHMSDAGYVHTGISSFQNSRGLHYTTKFVKSSQNVHWRHEMTDNLLYYVRKAKQKNTVPFFLGATHNGLPRESPQVYSLLSFKSAVAVKKNDFTVAQYWMSTDKFSLDAVQRRMKIAYNRKGTPQVPVSAIVQYRSSSRTGRIRSRLIILLVSPKILQQAKELL